MEEGKELLYRVIEQKLNMTSQIDKEDIYVDSINLVELLRSILSNTDNLADMTDQVINNIIADIKSKNADSIKNDIIKIRDLLIGKRDYHLNIEISQEYQSTIDTVVNALSNLLEKRVPGIINIEEVEEKCKLLYRKLKRNEIISDFAFIESVVRDYNEIEYETNMVKVMSYINMHNLGILKSPKKNGPLFDIKYIIKPKLDDKIKEILKKIDVDYRDLPNYLIAELKGCNIEKAYETFALVKKNKAEDYGILHLINKENVLAKLVLILYATPDSVRGVVDSVRNEDGSLDIPLLKIIVNTILTCFIVRKNEYFKSRYEDYKNNMELLKSISINYKALLKRSPLFMIGDYEVLDYTLKYLEQRGLNKRDIVNKCYKSLSVDSALLIENVDVLNNYHVNLQAELAASPNLYGLLKVVHLEKKLNYLLKTERLNPYQLDLPLVYKLLITKIYNEAENDAIVWGEEHD